MKIRKEIMSMKTNQETGPNIEAIIGQTASAFFDGYIAMLALGNLSHQLDVPQLALSYWSCALIQIIAIALLPQVFYTNAYLKQIMLSGIKRI